MCNFENKCKKKCEEKKILKKFVLTTNNVFLKKIYKNYKIELTNSFDQTMLNTAFIENLYFYKDNKAYIYNPYFTKNQINTQVSTDLIYNDSPVINKNRAWLMDNNIWVNNLKGTIDFPKFKYYNFSNNQNISVAYQLICSSFAYPESSFYEISGIVERINVWIYYPNSIVYLLIDSNNKKIFAMQSYTTNLVNYNELIYLSNKLKLPNNWIYAYINLDNDKYLLLTSNEDAEVIKDDLYNAYQYVKHSDAPFLYKKYFPK